MILDGSVSDAIESDIHTWIDHLLDKQASASPEGDYKPFHTALLPRQLIKASSFERSFSTLLGKSYERHSAIIAESRFAVARLQHKTEGTMLESVDTEISDEVGRINQSHVFSNYFELVERIVAMEKRGSGKRVDRAVTSDLYLRDDGGNEVFFEIKTPKPNKEQCLNITRKHLWIHAMLKRTPPEAKTYFGMAYNPFGDENEYTYSFAKNHMDLERQTLIGRQYWDFLGGPGAYEELSEIYRRVGAAKSEAIRRMLAM